MKFRRIDHIRKRASWTRTGPQWPRGKFFTQLCGLPVSNGYVVAGAVVPAKTKCRKGWGITTHAVKSIKSSLVCYIIPNLFLPNGC